MIAIEGTAPLPAGGWWIEGHKVFRVPLDDDPLRAWPDRLIFEELGLIRLDIGDGGTTLTWDVDNVVDFSTYTAMRRLESFPPPINLAFFKRAWAFESYPGPDAARARIEQLVAMTGAPVAAVSTVTPLDPDDKGRLAPLIRRAVAGDASVAPCQCLWRFDADANDFLADYIGPRSSIAGVMGADWAAQAIGTNAAPSDETDAFNETAVEDHYRRVFETGETAIDQVAAITTPPNGPPLFITWHRLLEPWIVDGAPVGCRVTTEHVSQALPDPIVSIDPAPLP